MSTITITYPDLDELRATQAPLYCKYSGQSSEQDGQILLDLRDGE